MLATFDLATPHDREFLLARLRLMISTPALQARHLDSQYRLQEAFVTAIRADSTDPAFEFQARAAASACLGVAHIALLRWASEDGKSSLPRPLPRRLHGNLRSRTQPVGDVYSSYGKYVRGAGGATAAGDPGSAAGR